MKFKITAVALSLLCASSAHATSVFINEIHYDNTGSDTGEFFEIAAPVGTDLSGWSVELYNGSNGTTYNSISLTAETLIEDGNYSFLAILLPSNGLQNGSPDGLALVDNTGTVVQFLSYEGSLSASNGPANGLTSDDIGVNEPGTTPIGSSLQLSGTGSEYSDFTWLAPDAETPNAANNSQTFTTTVVDTAPSVVSSSPANGDSNVALDVNINLTFNEDVLLPATNPVSCTTEASITVTISGSGSSYVIDPDSDLPAGDTCTFTVSATDVTDLDETPDNMAEDFTISFSVVDPSIIIDLVINEFLADPAGDITGDANGDGTRDSGDDEFFELVNNGTTAVDISGWIVSDGAGQRHEFPSNSVVASGCAIVVFGGGLPNGVFGGALVQTASTGAIGLNNNGDSLTISNGVITVQVAYGSEGGNNQSLTLNPDVTGASFSQHSTITEANGALFSPGTKLDGTKFSGCTIPDIAPTVLDFTPPDGATEVSVDSTLSISFSEDVVVSQWPALSCAVGGNIALNGALTGSTFSLTPASNLNNNDVCTFTLPANTVNDIDGTADTLASDFVSSFATAELLVCNAPGTFTFISAIQGNSDASPLVGQTVTVQAVVTAIKPNSSSFFIQEEDADFDADPSTSEGLFVLNSNPANTPAVGDLVTVRGQISEFFGLTEMTISSSPLVCGSSQLNPVNFSLPFSQTDDLETLESMLVTSTAPLTVTDTFTLGRFGQVTLSNGLLFNPNNISIPGSAENDAIALSNSLNRIILDDGSDNQNPAVVPFPTGGLSASNTLRIGDSVSSLVAVVDYRFGDFQLVPALEPTFVATNPRTSQPGLTLGNLKVASLNVLNFFNTIDTGAAICGPGGNADCRGADDNGTDSNGLTEFDRQKVKTIAAITAMDADIIGLMEIENDGFGPESAIVELVTGINAVMGANTYAIVASSGPIGTDAISVALIYKPASVTLSGSPQILDSSNSISDAEGPLFNDGRNRPSLIQKFALVENGEEIVISVNHLKSKGSGCGAGDDSPLQGNCNLTRTRAAQALVAFLAQQFGVTPTLIIGDLNAYALEDPIMAITDSTGPAYTDLAKHFGGAQAYSYSFDGELGYLDHALASPSLFSKVVDTTEWHINADEPIVLDYNFEFISTEQRDSFFAPDAYRMSDHDPVVISLLLEPAALLGDLDGDGDVDFRDMVRLSVLIRNGQAHDLSNDFNNDGVVNILDVRLLRLMCTRVRCSTRD